MAKYINIKYVINYKILRKWIENHYDEYNLYFDNPNSSTKQISDLWCGALSKLGDNGKLKIHVWPLHAIMLFLNPVY